MAAVAETGTNVIGRTMARRVAARTIARPAPARAEPEHPAGSAGKMNPDAEPHRMNQRQSIK